MASNVVLIGMMGSGKSTVGRLIAERTGMQFIDVDEVIENRADKPIAELFDELGEAGFREKETEALRETLAATHAIIATGGGAVTRAENRRLLRQLGIVFWLDAPAEVLLDRIGDDESRPMLRGGDALKRLEQLLSERREAYAEASDIHLDTTELSPEEIADRVEKELEDRTGADEDDDSIFATIVAIDGPVGSGKSTLARLVAERLGYTHVDTGAMYRCVTLEVMRRNVPLTEPDAMAKVAHSIDIRFDRTPRDGEVEMRVLLNGEDVSMDIRSPEVSRATSPVADAPGVRAEMARLQREIALRGRSVLEGRDISTVVVPEAKWKFYLVASLEERTMRRFRQYEQQGKAVDLEELRTDIATRDERDRSRSQGALKLAEDATIFDTTGFTLEEVVDTMAGLIQG